MTASYTVLSTPPADWLAQFPDIPPLILQLLYHRQLHTPAEVEQFLHPEYERDLHDPFLFRDMEKVISRIIRARDQAESVVVYGDYDADGVCASSLLYSALQEIGIQQLQLYLPHRDTEGYGLNDKAIRQFAEQKTQLIITVDCGVSNVAEVALATKLGMDVIVTDHHVEPPQLPADAYALINPQVQQCGYPFPMLAGVGVAFKIVQALRQRGHITEQFEKWLLDLVAISTVTDCMPLRDENRVLVKYGLVVLNKTRRLGLQKLIAATHRLGTAVTTSGIAFRLGPWINAAGRMDHANMAVALLLASDAATADQYVQKLASANTLRQQQTETMFQEALAQTEQQSDQPVLYVYGDHWPLGLIGLVAGKLVTTCHKPTFVMTEHQGQIFGSGRSLPGLDMIALLQALDTIFSRYGGHAMACGFTLRATSDRPDFADKFTAAASPILQHLPATPAQIVVAKLGLMDITWEFVEQLQLVEPYGEHNPEPVWLLENVRLQDFQAVGKSQQHLRLVLADSSTKTIKAIAFGFGAQAEHLHLGDTLSLIVTVGINQWNGQREIQLVVKTML